MADLTTDQIAHVEALRTIRRSAEELATLCRNFAQTHAEVYDTTQDLDLSLADNLEATYGFDAGDVNVADAQFCAQYVTFWDGGAAIADRERGKDIRRIR